MKNPVVKKINSKKPSFLKRTNVKFQFIIILLLVGIILNVTSNYSLWSTIFLGTALFFSTYLLKSLNIKL